MMIASFAVWFFIGAIVGIYDDMQFPERFGDKFFRNVFYGYLVTFTWPYFLYKHVH